MEIPKLNRCPFCGSEKASLDDNGGGAFVYGQCDECGAKGPPVEKTDRNLPSLKAVNILAAIRWNIPTQKISELEDEVKWRQNAALEDSEHEPPHAGDW